MKRLTEESFAAGTPESTLAELVKRSEPFRANPFRKRMLMQRLSRAVLGARPLGFLRPALGITALAVLGTAGIAGASYGWFKGSAEQPGPPAARPSQPTPLPPATPRAEPALEAVPSPEASAEPVKAIENPRARRSLVKQRALADGEDPTEVLEAIRALRKRGDAARAQVLLDQYLRAHPTGALSEDALVLSIEAALARRDPHAGDYAKRYLSRFPNGRFKNLAQRVLSTSQ